MTQPDLLRNSPAELERVNLIAAETALKDPFYPPKIQQYRSEYFRREAARCRQLLTGEQIEREARR